MKILYLQSDLLHDLPVHGLFNRLPDFCKSGNQCIFLIAAPRIASQENLISLCHTDDHCRTDLRVLHQSTARAVHHTLSVIVYHPVPALRTVTPRPVPFCQLKARHCCKCSFPRPGRPKQLQRLPADAFRKPLHRICPKSFRFGKEISNPVNGK